MAEKTDLVVWNNPIYDRKGMSYHDCRAEVKEEAAPAKSQPSSESLRWSTRD